MKSQSGDKLSSICRGSVELLLHAASRTPLPKLRYLLPKIVLLLVYGWSAEAASRVSDPSVPPLVLAAVASTVVHQALAILTHVQERPLASHAGLGPVLALHAVAAAALAWALFHGREADVVLVLVGAMAACSMVLYAVPGMMDCATLDRLPVMGAGWGIATDKILSLAAMVYALVALVFAWLGASGQVTALVIFWGIGLPVVTWLLRLATMITVWTDRPD